MGACLEYAARRGVPLMLYVFSDGSLSSGGQVDNSVDGRGKCMWTSDNQSTAASFFLVYNPRGRPQLLDTGAGGAARHQQIGYFRPDGSVETVRRARRRTTSTCWSRRWCSTTWRCTASRGSSPRGSRGTASARPALRDSLTAFNPIVNGRIA